MPVANPIKIKGVALIFRRLLFCLAGLCILFGLFLLADRLWPLPLTEAQMVRVVAAEDGTPLWRYADKNGVWRYPITLDKVSPYYLQALLTYEDRWFYIHPGVNPFALARALWQDLRNGQIVSGGSTLTMQVARIIDPHPRTVLGKLRQLWRTLQLEWHLPKRKILEIYLNRAPYGGTLQGIEAASWAYLSKPASELTRGEAALMAVLPQAPSRLRPDRYPQRAQVARYKVLQRLADYHVWTEKQVNEIRQEPVWIAPRQSPQLAPLLARRLMRTSSSDVMVSTIDASLQRRLEDLARSWKSQMPEKTSVGVLVVDHTTMKVRAYLGSLDLTDDSRFGHVDMVSAWRSPGSTLKPFLYGLALDEGLIHSESLLQDVPRQFGDYRPGNFDTSFHGPVSASDALKRSLNLPAVQLLEVYSPKKFAAKLRNVGVELRLPAYTEPNLSIILGGASARLDQLVMGFSAFARQGKVAPLRFTAQDKLQQGRTLLSPGAAWIVRRILAGEARPASDKALPLIVPLAWKTGTSYGYRDAWALGINARYTIGVWVGRPDNTAVPGQSGVTTAIPLMHQINNLLANDLRKQGQGIPTDPRPPSVSYAEVCWPSGQQLPEGDTNCRQRRIAWVLNGTIPPTLPAFGQDNFFSNQPVLWLNHFGKQVAADCEGASPHRIDLWPLPLEPWLPLTERRSQRLPPIDKNCPPIKQQTAIAPLLILGVNDKAVLRRLPTQSSVELRLNTQGGSGQRWWFLNGQIVGQKTSLQLNLVKSGDYQVSVLDESGQTALKTFRLE